MDKTVIQILGELINEHNSQVESKKQFVVGVVTIDVPEGMMNLETNYESTLSVVREKICNEYDGYIRIRRVDGIRYLDIVKIEDYGNTCLQPVQFGRNLLKYARNLSAGNVVTCIVPLGKEAEDGTFMTINSANNGLNYLFNQEAVNSFGWIRRVVKFPEITDAKTLLEEGDKWLKQNQYARLIIEVNAVDLSLFKVNMDSFNLGDYVNAKAKPFGLDAWYYIRKKITDLLHPDKNTITIGDTVLKSYTQQIKQEVGNIEKEIPSATKILLAARQNASNLIKAATTGFIVLNMDENGNPKELLVMDAPDIETAKKVWRWNINGLGYSSNGYNGEYALAMTMDGAIVADFIASGTMFADRIKGGTLTLGGEDNTNGVLNVLDKNGALKGKWTKDGIEMELSDGSKVIMSPSEGFYRLVGNTKNMYNSLFHTSTHVFYSSGVATITLPEEFKGKNVKVFSVIQKIRPSEHGFFNALDYFNSSAEYNAEDNTVKLYAYGSRNSLSYDATTLEYLQDSNVSTTESSYLKDVWLSGGNLEKYSVNAITGVYCYDSIKDVVTGLTVASDYPILEVTVVALA